MTWAGSLILVAAGVLLLAGVHGDFIPRPGRLRISRYPVCWDIPLAFFVRHRGQGLLFYRALEPDRDGKLPEQYFVIALPQDVDESDLRFTQFVPPEDSRLIGVVPLAQLRSDLSIGEWVDAAPLAALAGRAAS